MRQDGSTPLIDLGSVPSGDARKISCMKISIVFIEERRLCRAQLPSRSSVITSSLILDTKSQVVMTGVQPHVH